MFFDAWQNSSKFQFEVLYRTFSQKWLHFICKNLKNKVAQKCFYHTYFITTHIQISGSIKVMNTTIPIFLRQAV